MNRNRLNGSMHTSHPTMATLVNRAASWWVNHWEGRSFFVKMSYDFSMGATTIQYCVKSELFGTFICKFSFPSTWKTFPRHCLKFSLQLLQLVQSIIPFMKGYFEVCMRVTCLHVWLKSSWFQKHFRFFVKTHTTREERQLGAVQLAWSSIISARPF